MNTLVIDRPGMLTTVQDLGRSGYRKVGVNPGGVMDRTAARIVNLLVGNDESEAVLEMHFPAPQIRFEGAAIAAIGGADFSPRLNGQEIDNWRPTFLNKDDVLTFSQRTSGSRAYLAVAGGFSLDKWLGSASTNLAAGISGFNGRRLRGADLLYLRRQIEQPASTTTVRVADSLLPLYSRFPTVRFIAGAEFARLDPASRALITTHDFNISNKSDRMGFRLSGPALKLAEPTEILSSAVNFGTMQLLPNGQLVVLMVDHQTTGGYPRVGHIISRDLPLMAQLDACDKVAFHLVELEEAEQLALDFERNLSFLRVGCRFQGRSWAG